MGGGRRCAVAFPREVSVPAGNLPTVYPGGKWRDAAVGRFAAGRRHVDVTPYSPPPGLDFFQYGILCEGDTLPDPISVSRTNEQEEPEKDAPYARLDRWLETSRPESFTEDEVLRKTLTGAQGVLYRYRGGCVELAVPASDHAHLAPVLLFTRAETLRGGTYFVLKLSAEGMPRRADEPSTD